MSKTGAYNKKNNRNNSVKNEFKKQKRIKRQVKKLRLLLMKYGFEERALADLEELVKSNTTPYAKKLAAIDLARWYANLKNRNGAVRCLELIPAIKKLENNSKVLRQTAVMEAECNQITDNTGTGKRVIKEALKKGPHTDLFLAAANLEENFPDKVNWINKALSHCGISEIFFNKNLSGNPAFDWLENAGLKQDYKLQTSSGSPRVSVILPAYNAEETIRVALNSLINQTWPHTEIIVVDDCSTDKTKSIVEEFVKNNFRVKLLKCEKNRGTFTALNMGLKVAAGEFITTHGADCWSHPEKIATQANHLIRNANIMANTSQLARCYADFKFYRRGRYGIYTTKSHGSFMFRRIPVTKALGYWDCVRFSADSEFMRRFVRVFGKKALADLDTGPLAFSLQSTDSLTGHRYFGGEGYYRGVRKEYYESQKYFHKKNKNYYYKYPQTSRPFPVPEPMLPEREVKESRYRCFDVILASDFRLKSDNVKPDLELIKLLKKKKLRIGLVQMARYDISPEKTVNYQVRSLLDGNQVQMLVYGEKVKCELLIIRDPAVMDEWQRYVPKVDAEDIRVVIDRLPLNNYKEDKAKSSNPNYSIKKCCRNLKKYFHKTCLWHPDNASIRKELLGHHMAELNNVVLSDEDWGCLIKSHKWLRGAR